MSKMTYSLYRLARTFAKSGALALTSAHPADAAPSCETLVHLHIPAAEIGLPSRGANIETAQVHTAESDIPETCRVTGAIVAAQEGVPPIRFEVNLPRMWNSKALHFGGGGLNGVVIDGLHSMPGASPIANPAPNPLARGYATFGSDSGHQAANPADASFGRNAEARANYAGEAVKRTHDAALAIIRRFYGAAPRRTYFAGGSKGGHEGLVAAQRYGADYDGVIAYYPAKDSVALILAWGALSQSAYGQAVGALSKAKQQYFKQAVLDACDALDGTRDGIVANTAACAATISPTNFHCAPGATDTSNCLTDGEVRVLDFALRRQSMPYPLANGVAALGPFPVLNGAILSGAWLSPAGPDATAYGGFVNGVIRNFWTHDDTAHFATLDTTKYRDAILAYSRESDATSTDLDAFSAHGGKLILVQGTTDMLVPPSATTDYFLRVAARYGKRTATIAKYFVQPGFGHGFGDFTLAWDSLAALDAWVESGAFPVNPIATDANPATRDRQMPLCEFPAYPRYIGGDNRVASNFYCALQ